MDNDREIDQVLMNIRGSSGAVIGVSLISVRLALKTLTFLMRMAKKGLLAAKNADNLKSFIAKTEGNFTVYNIPLSAEKAGNLKEIGELQLKLQNTKNPFQKSAINKQIQKLERGIPELDQLKKLEISHCVLPKLNGSSQTIQIAVDKKNDQAFKNWFLNHLTTELGGGEKAVEDIKVLTEGNYAIINLPFEGEEFQDMLSDFKILDINYAVLPDLKVGDNNSQIAVPNADRSKLEAWFKIWREKQLKSGKEPGEMYVMDQGSYMSTAAMGDGDYEKTADPVYKEANAEFAQQAKDVPWKPAIQKENCEDYVALLQNDNYEKISINADKLLNYESVGKEQEMQANGYFISRVPYTYKDRQVLLAVPENRVFLADNGKTYIAFLAKNEKTMFLDRSGNVQLRNFREAYGPYDKVTRQLHQVERIKKGAPLPTKTPNPVKNVKNIPAPKVPKL